MFSQIEAKVELYSYHLFHTGSDVRIETGVNGFESRESRQHRTVHHGAWTTG